LIRIVEQKVSAGNHDIFDLDEFLSRPLYAHLAHQAEHGPRESPVWFHWDGGLIWIIGGTSFPKNLKREPVCALGIVDWDVATGLNQHVGLRGRAEVVPFDAEKAKSIFRRYFGPDEQEWDGRFADVFTGELGLELIRFVPETVIMRDQSYTPTHGRGSGDVNQGRPNPRFQPSALGVTELPSATGEIVSGRAWFGFRSSLARGVGSPLLKVLRSGGADVWPSFSRHRSRR